MIILNNQYNIGHICTRLQCDKGLAEQVALRWVSATGQVADTTFAQLEKQSNRFANVLDGLGLKTGDVLFTLLPKTPEQFTCFLGTLKKQLLCAPLFANIGDEALFDRLLDAQAQVLVTRQGSLKKIERIRDRLPQLKLVLLIDSDQHLDKRTLSYARLMAQAPTLFDTPTTPADMPSVLHYTSGSTGKPKGVVHCHGSIVTQHASAREILKLQADDMYWCTADQGWVTGTSYGIIAPWSMGITQLHYGGSFNSRRWLELLATQGVSVWYTAPTALRLLISEVTQLPDNLNLQRLRHIFSVGEPLNPEVNRWAQQVLKREVYDTWFQTETGAIMIANRPGLTVRPGSMGISTTATQAVILNDQGLPAPDGTQGLLALTSGWPAMFTGYLNNPGAYREKFDGGYYLSGDIAVRDKDGYFWFKGRNDDIINTGGHLISPFEIESILLEREEVVESGVIAIPDALLYEKIVVFVKLADGYAPDKELEVQLRLWITHRVSSIATPHDLVFVDQIPKNNSGKIMRRVLKSRYLGLDSGDTTTLEGSADNDGTI